MDMLTAADRWLALCDQLWDVQDALDRQRSAHHALTLDQRGCPLCDSLTAIIDAIDTYLADESGGGKELA
jgi:hypothetical protein